MESKINITILVPVYGVEKYIERCVRSLFEQTYENIGYIFVDDCSPDNSIGVLKRVLCEYPHRIPYVRIIRHNQNRGLGAARNTAVENCSTDFLLHVDSDDWLDKNVVEMLLKKQSETGADIITYDVKMHFSQKIQIRTKPVFKSNEELVLALSCREINGGVCGELIRTSLYKDHDIKIVEGINMSEDFQVNPRLAYFAKNVSTANGIYYHYFFANQNSYTHNENINTCRQVWKSYEILEDFFSDKDGKYLIALKKGKKKTLARQLMSGCLHSTGKEIFVAAHQLLRDLSETNENCMKLQEKIAIRIPVYWMLRWYMYSINFLKRTTFYKM